MSIWLGMLLATGLAAPDVLVSTATFAEMEDAVAVDAREADAFREAHLPGAAHLDYNDLSEEREGVTGLLKPLDELHAILAGAGLDPDETIVIYSGMEDTRSVVRATRLFWALEFVGYPSVRLLDGGLAKWRAEGRPIEQGETTVVAVDPEKLRGLDPVEGRYATREAVLEAQGAQKGRMVDLRAPDYFTGETKSDAAPRAGRITGARNAPFAQFLEEPYFTFKSPEIIRELLEAGKQDTGDSVITYCNTGRVATVGYAAHRIAGFEDVAVYDGSMADWGRHTACPISTGTDE